MQHNKINKKNSEFEIFVNDPEKLTSSLTKVMDKFKIKKHFAIFDFIKTKGIAISSLLNILVMLPFLGVISVNAFIKSGLMPSEIDCKKDAFYDVLNQEFINWRKLLLLHAKRFRYLIKKRPNLQKDGPTAMIFDDSDYGKTGKKIEKVSMVYDHCKNMYILGYKILVCGFWDGGSFIPIDFSIHREKGSRYLKLIKDYKSCLKAFKKLTVIVDKLQIRLDKQYKIMSKRQAKYQNRKTKTNKKLYLQSEKKYEQLNCELLSKKKLLSAKTRDKDIAYKKLKRFYNKGKLYGLSTKERQAQFKKNCIYKELWFYKK